MSNDHNRYPNDYDEWQAEGHFNRLFRKYEKPLYNFSFKVTRSSNQASDIVQDVFLKLWENRSELDSIIDMEAWLHRVAKNKIIDVIRKIAAERRMRDTLWKNMESHSQNTEFTIRDREYNRLVENAILALPDKRREVYRLKRDAGLNYQEISQKLSISQHTVKNQMSAAIRSIHKYVVGSLGMLVLFFFK